MKGCRPREGVEDNRVLDTHGLLPDVAEQVKHSFPGRNRGEEEHANE